METVNKTTITVEATVNVPVEKYGNLQQSICSFSSLL